ncbi:WecB/TagA/CpsF family glycosyltransferase [Modestobacter sp. I12A-02628]|uniref:WecB/TagA/CpsF family glycosyltransferase n=1 Tax=Goekera deserti TaxID=2497753 RepID=A0A7K3WIP2_9ACTN|nr:WecB/TagA/CpsF family glycosyltransferase [Goekera deserti]MPQ99443.1 WecB/TagA/CpsF family glycosyltransferase [Goekera deserti]NDI48930.1 WecB/TagA/CpsF family glycosyltransferase [Goekera deserti]NEL55600.1 WecB/TagA/CpsF family glycosyltransferase [Goekera deserti]
MRTTVDTAWLGPVSVTGLTERAVGDSVVQAISEGRGGSIVTVNIDILRAATRDPAYARLVAAAELSVADGMPVVWAARLAGARVPERVTGASLVFSLCESAARTGRSVYLIGGLPGVPEAAGQALAARYPGLRVVGAVSPPFGFDQDEQELAALESAVTAAAPDLVLVGLGFPKQERLIARLRPLLPHAWFLGCGAGIPMAAGQFRRAPQVAQRLGAEWLHRLAQEPRRLARRYLVDDLPFAVLLLARTLAARVTATAAPRPVLPVAVPPTLTLVPPVLAEAVEEGATVHVLPQAALLPPVVQA